MKVLDWVSVFDANRVEYVDRGPNVKRGEINIRCPFCGTADPSHHMGINLETGWYACWRNKTAHSGKSPLRLLMALLHVSYERARDIAGFGNDYLDPEGFDTLKARLQGLGSPAKARSSRACIWPAEFVPITGRGFSRQHWRYLEYRGFDDVEYLVERYRLSCTRTWPQSYRIILPFIVNGEIVTWTGRAIAASTARYLDQPLDDAAIPPKETFYNHDALVEGGEALVVVEGPVDVLKIDFYGRAHGVRAVGMSTSTMGESQTHLLAEARGRFRSMYVMGDQTNTGTGRVDSMRLRQQLGFIDGVRSLIPPYKLKDAGQMSPTQAETFAINLSNGIRT